MVPETVEPLEEDYDKILESRLPELVKNREISGDSFPTEHFPKGHFIIDKAVEILKGIYDPEIPVNIYEIGLIYDIVYFDDGSNSIIVRMTLTSPFCPVADELVESVKEGLENIEGIEKVDVLLVWDHPWNIDMMTEDAKLELGIDDL